MIAVLGLVDVVVLAYLAIAWISYVLLFWRAAWRGDRWYLSLRWPMALPLAVVYYVRWRMLERRARRAGSKHKSPASVVAMMAVTSQCNEDGDA